MNFQRKKLLVNFKFYIYWSYNIQPNGTDSFKWKAFSPNWILKRWCLDSLIDSNQECGFWLPWDTDSFKTIPLGQACLFLVLFKSTFFLDYFLDLNLLLNRIIHCLLLDILLMIKIISSFMLYQLSGAFPIEKTPPEKWAHDTVSCWRVGIAWTMLDIAGGQTWIKKAEYKHQVQPGFPILHKNNGCTWCLYLSLPGAKFAHMIRDNEHCLWNITVSLSPKTFC